MAGYPEFRGAIWRKMRAGAYSRARLAYFALQITIRRPREILKVDRAVARATCINPFGAYSGADTSFTSERRQPPRLAGSLCLRRPIKGYYLPLCEVRA